MRHYIYTFKPVPDTNLVTIDVLRQNPATLEKAIKVLHNTGREGYITCYPSTKPVYAFVK